MKNTQDKNKEKQKIEESLKIEKTKNVFFKSIEKLDKDEQEALFKLYCEILKDV